MSREPVILHPGMPDFYDGTKWERKPHGTMLINGVEVAHTLQCPHCNAHFISRKGSGHRRTYCMLCNAVTCGHPDCDRCIPWEKKMELMERGWSLERILAS